jgi:hypothetical protein
MRKSKSMLIVALSFAVLAMVFASSTISLSDQGAPYSPAGSGNVVIMIQSGDPELIFYALLYADRAIKNQWMDNVKIVLWGPAEKTIAGLSPDSEQMKLIKSIQSTPGKHNRIWCCKACSDRYGVTDKMEKLGFEVFHVGNATSYLLKLGYRMWNW